MHSTLKIQPTTSPTFVFNVSASVRNEWSYERKLLDSRFGRNSSCFYSHFIISLKKYDDEVSQKCIVSVKFLINAVKRNV
jgi:hypothetical protein